MIAASGICHTILVVAVLTDIFWFKILKQTYLPNEAARLRYDSTSLFSSSVNNVIEGGFNLEGSILQPEKGV